MTKLKTCPYCGGYDLTCESPFQGDGGYIECSCGARGPYIEWAHDDNLGLPIIDDDLLWDAWNKRVKEKK